MNHGIILLTFSRCGGGFLLHSLSSHPEIIFDDSLFWLRGLYNEKPTQEQLEKLFDCLLSREFRTYLVSGTKVFPHQIKALPDSFWIERDTKFIFLRRRNVMRVIFASEAKRASKKGQMLPIHINVKNFVKKCQYRVDQYRRAQDFVDRLRIKGTQVLELDYADIVGGEGKTAHRIPLKVAGELCDFLTVRRKDLAPTSGYFDSRQHPVSMKTGVSNWGKVQDELKKCGWSDWIKQEDIYDTR